MAKSTNRYAVLGMIPSASKDQAAFRVVTTVAGVAGGAMLGAAVGKPAMLLGLALAGAGAYFDKPQVIAAGAGMAFAPSVINASRAAELATTTPAGGKPSMVKAATARVKSLLDAAKGNVNPFKKDDGMSGFGEVASYYAGSPAYYAAQPQLTDYSAYNGYRGIDSGSDPLDLGAADFDFAGVGPEVLDLSGTEEVASVLM